LKRSASDVIRRGFDSTLANWQLIVIRVVESFAGGAVLIASIVAIIVPIVASAGISDWNVRPNTDPRQAVLDLIVSHMTLIFYVIGVIVLVFGVLIAIHAFVTAGCAAVFVDAERRAGAAPPAARDAYRAFTTERFFAAARDAWWRTFWLYNATWSVGALILLVPIIPVLFGTIAFSQRENVPGAIATGCGGIALILLVAIPVAFVISIWTEKAVILCAGYGVPLRTALRDSWRLVRADFGRHAGVAFIMMVIMFGMSMLLSGFLAPFTFGTPHTPFGFSWFGPQIMVSVVQNAVTNGVGCWFIACFAAMTEEPR
jgi:hypothetical protein